MLTAARLTLSEICKRYGDRTVLDRVSLSIRAGETVGIVGDNGSGKSTLLRLLAGQEPPDNGEVCVSAPGGIGHLPRSLALPGTATVAEAIDLALADIRELENRLRTAEIELGGDGPLEPALGRYAELLARFEARGGYQADQRVDIALAGLGLPGLARDRTLGTLSGGQRSRLALAATLAAAPEVLLLDEPTNDLDDAAVQASARGFRGRPVPGARPRSRGPCADPQREGTPRTAHRQPGGRTAGSVGLHTGPECPPTGCGRTGDRSAVSSCGSTRGRCPRAGMTARATTGRDRRTDPAGRVLSAPRWPCPARQR